MKRGVGPGMGGTSASGSSASSCTTASMWSNSSPTAWSSRAARTASTAFSPASRAAGKPIPAESASAIFTSSSSQLEKGTGPRAFRGAPAPPQRRCAARKVCSALAQAPIAHITCPMRQSPTPHEGPASRRHASASMAASAGWPRRSLHRARLASSAGRHPASAPPGVSASSISSAKLYSSSAPEKSAHHAKMLPMHTHIRTCSPESSASMFTASNARSNHVLPSGSALPLARFFAYRDIALSAKSSFSAYFVFGTACAKGSRRFFRAFRFALAFFLEFFFDSDDSASKSAASNNAHPATSSAGESVTPCGHAFLRRSYHSHALMCVKPVASHAASIASRDTSNVPTALLSAPPGEDAKTPSPPQPPRGVGAAGAARASSSRLEMAMEVGASAAALWNERTAPSLPPHAS